MTSLLEQHERNLGHMGRHEAYKCKWKMQNRQQEFFKTITTSEISLEMFAPSVLLNDLTCRIADKSDACKIAINCK